MNTSKDLKKIIIIIIIVSLTTFCVGCSYENINISPEGDWSVIETDNYIYYYIVSDEFDFEDVNNAITRLENFYEIIAPIWTFSSDSKIKYYKFQNREQREKLTGMIGNGKAFFKENTVHSIYAADAHEVSHIITTQNILKSSAKVDVANFWLEGIAMYYTWPSVHYNENSNEVVPSIGFWQGENVHNHLRKNFLVDDNLSDLSSFVYNNRDFDKLDDDLSYPMAGSFITYLVGKNHSNMTELANFKSYLKEINNCNSKDQVLYKFNDLFGKSFSEYNADWLNFLRNLK